MKTVLTNLNILAINVMLITYVLAGIEKMTHMSRTIMDLSIELDRFNVTFGKSVLKALVVIAICIEIMIPFIINYAISYKKYTIVLFSVMLLSLYTIFTAVIYFFPPFGDRFYPFISSLSSIGGLAVVLASIKSHLTYDV